MPYTQKDIIKIKGERLPEGIGPHPFLIINCERSISHEKNIRRYLGVMLTHSPSKDRYTFEIKPGMIDGNIENSWHQIRTNIIVGFREVDISPDSKVFIGKMKKIYFEQVMNEIKNYTLQIDNP